jgi:hypothetical protein
MKSSKLPGFSFPCHNAQTKDLEAAGVTIRNLNAFHWKKVLDKSTGTKIERNRFDVKKF